MPLIDTVAGELKADTEVICGEAVRVPLVLVVMISLMSCGGSFARVPRSFKKRVRRVGPKEGDLGDEGRVLDAEGAVDCLSMSSASNSTNGTI